MAVAVVAAATPVGSQQPRGAQDWRRIGDSADPVVASVLIAQDAFPDTGDAEGVVLAREDVFADALAGAALAGTTRPILYTTGGPDAELRLEVAAEIGRLLVLIIPGGTREAIGLDAGPLGEEIVVTGYTAAGPQGQIIRPPVDDGEATTVATWEVTAQDGPDGTTFAVQVQPVGGP